MDRFGRFTPSAGLCETCANVRVVESGKGSRFYLCRLSSADPRFPKYPGIPVLKCRGYTPAGEAASGGVGDAEPRGDG